MVANRGASIKWVGLTTLPPPSHMAILIVINFRLLHGQAPAIFMAIFHLFSFSARNKLSDGNGRAENTPYTARKNVSYKYMPPKTVNNLAKN